MTDTILSSATKEVVIGFERRFVMIGERINPTGRKSLGAEMAAGDYRRVVAEALAQVEAGAQDRTHHRARHGPGPDPGTGRAGGAMDVMRPLGRSLEGALKWT